MASFPTNGDDVIFGTDADNTINSLGGNDQVFGGLGDDILQGSTGDDMLSGGLGVDILVGGSGSDTAFYGFASEDVRANLNLGFGFLTNLGQAADGDQFFSIENLTGGFGNDVLIGNSAANVLKGNSGNDQINGGAGRDTIDAGLGNDFVAGNEDNDVISGNGGDDIIRGGSGGDTMTGGLGSDTLDYAGIGPGVTIDLVLNTASGGDATGDVISGFENVTGTLAGDILSGTRGANILQSQDGDDTLDGRSGNDYLNGQGGDDTIAGGSFNDLIVGSTGVDNLTGGTGADRFFFNGLADSGVAAGQRDIMTDFQQGSDRIEVNAIDAIAATAADNGFTFIGTAGFTSGVAGEVRYNINAQGNTIISFRVDTSSGAGMQVELTGAINLTAGDFIL